MSQYKNAIILCIYEKKHFYLFYLFRLTIENEENKTTFILQKAKRTDSGIYTITAKNDSGTDKAEVEIIVLSEFNFKYITNIFHLC